MISPKVYIIILNHNGLQDTIECLESLQKITYPNYGILVIDNASFGNDVSVLRQKFGDTIGILRNRHNYGFQKASNVGIQLTFDDGADYILLLNNDTVVKPDFLDKLVEVAEPWVHIGVLSPSLCNYYSPQIDNQIDPVYSGPRTIDWWRNTCKSWNTPLVLDKYFRTEYIVGAAMLIKRSTIEEIGYLSEDFFLTVGDTDYCIRATRAGIGMAVVRDSIVYHKGGSSIDEGIPKGELNWSRVWEGYLGWQRLRWRYLSKPMYFLTSIFLLSYWPYRLLRRVV